MDGWQLHHKGCDRTRSFADPDRFEPLLAAAFFKNVLFGCIFKNRKVPEDFSDKHLRQTLDLRIDHSHAF